MEVRDRWSRGPVRCTTSYSFVLVSYTPFPISLQDIGDEERFEVGSGGVDIMLKEARWGDKGGCSFSVFTLCYPALLLRFRLCSLCTSTGRYYMPPILSVFLTVLVHLVFLLCVIVSLPRIFRGRPSMPHYDPLLSVSDRFSLLRSLVMGFGQAARELFSCGSAVLWCQGWGGRGEPGARRALWCSSLRTGPRGPRAGV